MSVRKFKFVSPGVFTKEIDNSQLPSAATPAGPVIVGRTPKGPGMMPVKVDSFEQFVDVFGNPVSGKRTGDVWREGNYQAPTYGSYAAQAYLAADVDSVTFVRLLGYKNEDAGDEGHAGWQTTKTVPTGTFLDNGGAFGLFVMPSGSDNTSLTGTLAAIWYVDSGSAIALSGTKAAESTQVISGGAIMNQTNDELEFTAVIMSGTTVNDVKYKTSFNFNKSSSKYIRNVFNTNPQTTGGVIPETNLKNAEAKYWLGETFEASVLDAVSDKGKAMAIILPLDQKADYRQDAREAHTGWFFSQDLTTNSGSYKPADMQKLFRIHALSAGQATQEELKISIQDLTYSRDTTGANPFGNFTLVVRKADDTDDVPQIVERFSNCNLNPLSQNYIGRRIGDRRMVWDSDQRVLKSYGNYDNISAYVRVEIADEIEQAAIDPRLLPFGVYGPPKYAGSDAITATSIAGNTIIMSGSKMPFGPAGKVMDTGSLASTSLKLEFPSSAMRISASAGGISNPKNAYFGLNVSSYMEISASSGSTENRADPGYGDYIYALSDKFNTSDDASTQNQLVHQWTFTLDELILSGTSTVYWEEDSRKDGNSITAKEGSWKEFIDKGYTRFTSPLYNGFDGLNIRAIEPFSNDIVGEGTVQKNYASNSIRRAIDTVSDPEFVDMNLLTVPGLTDPTLTEHMIQVCSDRGDAMAIIDIPNVYTPFTETKAAYQSFKNRLGSVSEAVSNLENREINSSYACTYYPWVQVRDTVSNALLWVPPSVVALGTFASSEAQSEVWFAPAGFNRGGLSEGSAGLPVVAVTERLTSKDRDDLYDANINPIASFPNEGIVIFGQKTLQTTPSALDRINVRRMMIFVKKQISAVANGILFDQNVRVTWNRFIAAADPILTSVQNRLGISEYKLILDDTTTTPDLVDQNIVYAKVYVKPAKAIEYIAIDFVITNSGAAFGD